MFTPPNPVALWGNAMQVSYIMAESQAVIAMRLMGMSGIWSVPHSEDARMVSEKVWAMTKAMTDASRVAMTGGDADAITAASLKPFRKHTRSTARRLAKRGFKRT